MADIITTLHPEGAPEDDLYPNVKDDNIPSNILRKGTTLWTNASPMAPLGEVDITLSDNLSNYQTIKIGWRFYAENTSKNYTECKTDSSYINISANNMQGNEIVSRTLSILGDNSLKIGHGFKSSNFASGVTNDYFCTITDIIGLK